MSLVTVIIILLTTFPFQSVFNHDTNSLRCDSHVGIVGCHDGGEIFGVGIALAEHVVNERHPHTESTMCVVEWAHSLGYRLIVLSSFCKSGG